MEAYIEPAKLKDYVTNEVYIEGHTKSDMDALIDYEFYLRKLRRL